MFWWILYALVIIFIIIVILILLALFLSGSSDSTLELNTDKSYLLEIHGSMTDKLIAIQKPRKGQVKCAAHLFVSTDHRSRRNVNFKLDPSSRVDIVSLMENQNETLTGKFFLCRIIAPPFQMSSILTVVDDPEGEKAVRLALYDYPTNSRPLLHVLPVGTTLAVKNPWFKRTLDGGYSVRVDSPKNVVVMDPTSMEKLFPDLEWEGDIPEKYAHLAVKQKKPNQKKPKQPTKTAVDFKNRGNLLFAEKKYSEALECYKEGLSLEPKNIELLSNRSAVYINLNCFHRALEDAEKVHCKDSNHVKGNYRKARSLWGLKRYDDAISFLKNITSKSQFSSDAEFTELLSKYESLKISHNTGNYAWRGLFHIKSNQVDVFADYCGPIKINPSISGKGRGIVATDDISPGTLLIASKAFAMYYLDVEKSSNPDGPERATDLNEELSKIIAQRLTLEPEHKKDIYDLFAGPNAPPLTDTKRGGTVDQTRLKNICSFNSFSGNTNSDIEEPFKKTGLWILPSYINHSCWESNCTWIIVGDVMIVRSFKSISKGEEILISYINPLHDSVDREIDLSHYKFVCECSLCQEDRRDSKNIQKRRQKILRYIEMYAGTAELLENQISKLETLRSAAPKLNNVIVSPLLDLAHMHFLEEEMLEGIEAVEKGYNLLKNTSLVEEPLEYILNIVVTLIVMNVNGKQLKKDIDKWVEILKRELLNRYGAIAVIKQLVGKKTFITGHKFIDILEGYGLRFN